MKRIDILLHRRDRLEKELDMHLQILYSAQDTAKRALAEQGANGCYTSLKEVENLLLNEVDE